MAERTAEQTTMPSRTLVDWVLAAALILLGIFILTDVVIATAFSIIVIGWVAVISGVVSLIEAFLKQRGARMVTGIVSGVLLLVLGVLILANPVASALSLTIVLGLVFFVRGIASVVVGFLGHVGRLVLILGGLVSIALGVIVLFNLGTMTMVLLGVLLGVELVVTGVTMLATGGRTTIRV